MGKSRLVAIAENLGYMDVRSLLLDVPNKYRTAAEAAEDIGVSYGVLAEQARNLGIKMFYRPKPVEDREYRRAPGTFAAMAEERGYAGPKEMFDAMTEKFGDCKTVAEELGCDVKMVYYWKSKLYGKQHSKADSRRIAWNEKHGTFFPRNDHFCAALAAQGKTTDEIMEITGLARTTINQNTRKSDIRRVEKVEFTTPKVGTIRPCGGCRYWARSKDEPGGPCPCLAAYAWADAQVSEVASTGAENVTGYRIFGGESIW